MNKLAYGILSLVATESLAGYDINQIMKSFWQTTHSAIYPLLAELEQNKFLTHITHKQEGKPDKKIYSITNEGFEALKEWILSATGKAVVKDEMMLKVYCLKVLDATTSMALLDELEERSTKRLHRYMKSLEAIQQEINQDETKREAYFGRYLLVQKAINDAQQELKWCAWIRNLCDENNTQPYYENNFFNL